MSATEHPRFRKLPLAIIALGAAVHLGFLLQVFHIKSMSGLWFVLVVLAPWLVLLASLRVAAGRARMNQFCTVASAAFLLLGAWAYWDALYVHPDPQGGLVFIVIPVMGTLAAIGLLLALLVIRTRSMRPDGY